MKKVIMLISFALCSCTPDVPVQVATKSVVIEKKDTVPKAPITVEVDTTQNEYNYDIVVGQ